MNHFEIKTFNNEKEYSEWREKDNKETAKIFEAVYEHYMSKCENEDQRKIFHDWWRGVAVSQHEYKAHFSEEDHNEASGWIMECISKGFG